jgi:hypothetical protein
MTTTTILQNLVRSTGRRWTGLSRWFGPVRKATPRRRTGRLGVESLEDRCVPAVFNVNSLADVLNPAAGVVSLRSAIQQANQTPGGNTINLTVPGTYRITLPGTAGETDNAAGEFAILPGGGDLNVVNTSGGKVTIDGGGHNRVFDVNPGFNPASPTPKFTVTFQGLTITDGFVTDAANVDGPNASGGGIRDTGNASLTLIDDIVTDNTATADGGGVVMENTTSVPWTLTVQNSVISNNRAGDAGGGIDSDGSGKVFVTNSSITGNRSVNQGAGIWLDAIQVGTVFQTANLTVTGTLISGNIAIAAGNVGGGIGNAGNGTVTIDHSTVADNFSGGVGGGFGDENAQGTLVVLDSTFANNDAIGNGGGIEAGGPSTTINDSTITGNIGQANGGGIDVTSAAFTLNNTIVAQNQDNNNAAAMNMNFQGPAPDVFAAVTTGSGNFIGIGDANLTGITNGSNGNRIGTVAAPLDPLLGPLQNNGGQTPTRAPLPGSPVIDAGLGGVVPAVLTTDQRGFNRVVNTTVDIGAVEFQPPVTTTMLAASTGTVNLGQSVTFTATVTGQAPGSNTPQGTVTFTVDGVATPVALVTGVATFTTAALGIGGHSVTATYSGDVNFTSSTASVTETVLGLQDVTGQVTITQVMPMNKHGKKMKKMKANPAMPTFTIANKSGAAIQGPLYFVLDHLTKGIMLMSATGSSQTHVTPGDPFVLLTSGPLGAGQSVMVTLMFTAGNKKHVKMLLQGLTFTPFVLAGPGTV